MIDLDVLVFGGGGAGLLTLDTLRRAGWEAVLLESRALGSGQTVPSQGIIHGGGKYALRGVQDLEAVKAIREMPRRWRDAIGGKGAPDLSGARIVSETCLLWLPKGGFLSDVAAKGMMSIVVGAGLLSTKPVELPAEEWPEVLRASALRVYAMAEPVLDTRSVVEALAAPHGERIRLYDPAAGLAFDGGAVRLCSPALELRPRAIVFAAGEGNEGLLKARGVTGDLMQRRPLMMVLIRGPRLPELWGHCVVGGKTRLTVTTSRHSSGDVVWQVGGEISEKTAGATDLAAVREQAAAEIRRWLPGADLAGAVIGTYPAVRAESLRSDHRRPSGVQVHEVADAPPTIVAWPTKLALAPVLADEVLAHVSARLGRPAGYNPRLPDGRTPAAAASPWEEAEWFPVPSAAQGSR